MTRNVAEALLEHHFEDVRKGLRIGSLDIAKFSFHDALELFSKLPYRLREEMATKWSGHFTRAGILIDLA